MKIFDKRISLHLRIGYLIILCVAAYFIVQQIIYGVRLMSFVTVTSTVVEQYSVSNGERYDYYFVCEYEYNGNTYRATQNVNYSDKFSVGIEVKLKINPKRPSEVRNSSLVGGYCALDLMIGIILGWIVFRMNSEIKEQEVFKNRSSNYLESDYEINRRKQNENAQRTYEDSDFYGNP